MHAPPFPLSLPRLGGAGWGLTPVGHREDHRGQRGSRLFGGASATRDLRERLEDVQKVITNDPNTTLSTI